MRIFFVWNLIMQKEKKIEKYTEDILHRAGVITKTNLPSFQPLTYSIRNTNLQTQFQLTALDIKKLELMNSDLTPEQYMRELIAIGEKNSYANTDIVLTIENERQEVEELCYAELGRRMVQVVEKDIVRDFTKTNIYIRSYMMRSIVEYIEKLAKYYPQSIFILPNEKGLNFDPNEKPDEITQYFEHTQYVDIIRNVNHIIQNNIFENKYKQERTDYSPLVIGIIVLFILLLLPLMLVICSHSENPAKTEAIMLTCIGLLASLALLMVFGYSMHSYREEIVVKPIIEKIRMEIDEYFKFINGKTHNGLEWVIGQSFYWIEVRVPLSHDSPTSHKENAVKFQRKWKNMIRLNKRESEKMKMFINK